MSQPQQHAQYREYQPAYSPGQPTSYHQSRNVSPLVATHSQYGGGAGNASPLSPLQTVLSGQSSYNRSGHIASPATPSMAQAYNPQQWSQSQMGFQRVLPMASNTRETTGMEAAMPSPPPPYSPTEPTMRPSPMLEQIGFSASPTTMEAASSSMATVISPVTSSQAFPPPPNARNRDRSASNNRIFHTLQSFTGRGKQPAGQEMPVQLVEQFEDGRPPAARRAASAGHIPYSGMSTPMRTRQRQDSSAMQPTAVLPGPPPGPPPSGSRSQSLNRFGEPSSQSTAASAPTRRPQLVSALGPVPPTPADWVDGDNSSTQQYQPLRIDTGPRQQSLTRRPAQRDTSASGLRERRSRSKAAREGAPEDEGVVDGAVIESTVAGVTSSGTISRRREHNRKISVMAGQASPGTHGASSILTPPYTPAVGRADPGSATSERGADSGMPNDAFYKHALERHRQFLLNEAAAATDEDRLAAFANYIVHESRLRRDKYQAAYNAMAGDIVDLTRDMWRSYSTISRRVATPNTATSHGPSSTTSDGFPSAGHARSESSNDVQTPATENGSVDDNTPDHLASARQRGETFKPCLSPIPSMAVSSVHDDSSRGRAPSRWWEKSEGSGSIGKPERIEKSLRETKYMGINPALLRSSPQPEDAGQTPTPGASTFALAANEYPPEKVGWHEQNEYETPVPTPSFDRRRNGSNTDISDQMDLSRLVTLPPPYPRHHPAVNNGHPLLADLRNKHRALADNTEMQHIRDAFVEQDWNIQKTQQEEAKKRRAKMRHSMQEKLNEGSITFADAAQTEQKFEESEVERSKTNARVLFDAFEATVSHPLNTMITERLATADSCITQLHKDLSSNTESSDPNRAQEEGDEHPERLEKLTLLRWLFDAREALHKEMFELHAQRAEKYGEVVLTPYRMARLQNKIEEAEAFFLKDGRQRATAFHKEALQRCELFLAQIEKHVNSGVEDQLSAFWDIAPGLKEVVQHIPVVSDDGEEHLRLLDHFQFLVPPQELDENPAYKQFPLQYLYSVLSHAEKSTYQFIESQTNLWCLLHAVRELMAEANLKVIELETNKSITQDPEDELVQEMLHAKAIEQKRLTVDLQEKVGEVERQWKEALGEQLEAVRLGVRHWLEETGGWEDGLDG